MADKPKPEKDMEEEKEKTKKIVETKEDETVNKEKEVKKKSEEQNLKKKEDNQLTAKDKSSAQAETKPKEKKKEPIQKKPVIKKTEAIVNAVNLPISTKHTIAVCKFIKNKKIENAISDLEQVLIFKKAISMKGEIPHRKGKGIMSGRYPKKTTEQFIKLLKSLLANANANGLENPIIVESVANIASRPFGRFGRWRRKRTHVRIIAKEKSIKKKEEEK